jgi:hypothetical protein
MKKVKLTNSSENIRIQSKILGKDVIGSADAVLFRSREGESNIGNLVTDAMVWAHRYYTHRRHDLGS